MWIRAVWIEKGEEVEGVIPDVWATKDHVYWPPVANAEKMMKSKQTPTQSWRKFSLVKVKCKSESRKDCEDYDNTTTIESSEDESEELKRRPKKKKYTDFVTADTSDVTTDVNQDVPTVTESQETTQSNEATQPGIALPIPPVKLTVQESQSKRGADCSRREEPLPVDLDRQKSRSPLSRPGPTLQSSVEEHGSKSGSKGHGQRSSTGHKQKSGSELSWDIQSSRSLTKGPRDSRRVQSASQVNSCREEPLPVDLDRQRSRSPLSRPGPTLQSTVEEHGSKSGSKGQSQRFSTGHKQKSGSELSRDIQSSKSLTKGPRDSRRVQSASQVNSCRSESKRPSPYSKARSEGSKGYPGTPTGSNSDTDRSLDDSSYIPRSRSLSVGSEVSSGSSSQRSRSNHSRSPSDSLSDRSRSGDRTSYRSGWQQSRDNCRSESYRSHDRRSGSQKSRSSQMSEFHKSYDSHTGSKRSRDSQKSGTHKSYNKHRSLLTSENPGVSLDRAYNRIDFVVNSSSGSSALGSHRQRSLQPSSTNKSSRPAESSTSSRERKDAFPMSEAKFQKKVMYMLVEIRNEVVALKGRRQAPPDEETDSGIGQAKTLDDFYETEELIKNAEERRRLVQKLSLVGGVNVKDNVKRIMEKVMSNDVMSKFNMKGNRQKMSFEKTALVKVIQACAMKTLPCTEQDVDVAIGYCLKYAPDRRGGGGRKTGNTGPEHEPEDEEPFRL